MGRSVPSNRALIELELTSLIQKLSYLRGGGMTPRTFPPDEYAAIEAFGLSCCRLMTQELHAREPVTSRAYAFDENGDYKNPFDDEDTSPGYLHRKPKP